MILFPAIDILGGKAVRLAKGDFGARTDYDDDPLDAARRWITATTSQVSELHNRIVSSQPIVASKGLCR